MVKLISLVSSPSGTMSPARRSALLAAECEIAALSKKPEFLSRLRIGGRNTVADMVAEKQRKIRFLKKIGEIIRKHGVQDEYLARRRKRVSELRDKLAEVEAEIAAIES